MDPILAILAALIVVSAAGAMFLRNLVHCALCLAVTFGGLAMIYLKLGAQFVGFAQVLVYIGAVAILILFAILLTRSGQSEGQGIFSPKAVIGGMIAFGVFATIAIQIGASTVTLSAAEQVVEPSVKDLGNTLMTTYVLPLEVMGLLLTAAMIGAVVIALKDKEERS